MEPKTLIESAITRARALAGKREETTNDAPWLREHLSGTAWTPGEPYAFLAARACYGDVDFDAVEIPEVGDIVTWPDRAGIVIEVLENGAVRTIEFETTDIYPGDQSHGFGVFPKYRARLDGAEFLRVIMSENKATDVPSEDLMHHPLPKEERQSLLNAESSEEEVS